MTCSHSSAAISRRRLSTPQSTGSPSLWVTRVYQGIIPGLNHRRFVVLVSPRSAAAALFLEMACCDNCACSVLLFRSRPAFVLRVLAYMSDLRPPMYLTIFPSLLRSFPQHGLLDVHAFIAVIAFQLSTWSMIHEI